MASEKLLSAYSTIERALGMIEGVAFGLPKDLEPVPSLLGTAVEMIDGAMEEIRSGKID